MARRTRDEDDLLMEEDELTAAFLGDDAAKLIATMTDGRLSLIVSGPDSPAVRIKITCIRP